MGRLLNLGSLCIDQVYRVPRLSGAGETVASLSHQVFPGGKGLNQSLAAARAGAEVRHFGCIGDDGTLLVDVLERAGVDTSGIRQVNGTQSGHAVIQVNDDGENSIVIAGGANRCWQPEDIAAALDDSTAEDWVLLQNEINSLPEVLASAAASAARVAFNVAPPDAGCADFDLNHVDLLIVNDHEAQSLAGPEFSDPHSALAQITRRYPSMTAVMTLGADGLVYVIPGQPPETLAAHDVHAVDETAAGDAFIGYLMAGLLAGRALYEALGLGCAAGALAVTQAGAASSIPAATDVEALLRES